MLLPMPVVVNDRTWRCRRCSSAVMDVAVITQRQLGSRATETGTFSAGIWAVSEWDFRPL